MRCWHVHRHRHRLSVDGLIDARIEKWHEAWTEEDGARAKCHAV